MVTSFKCELSECVRLQVLLLNGDMVSDAEPANDLVRRVATTSRGHDQSGFRPRRTRQQNGSRRERAEHPGAGEDHRAAATDKRATIGTINKPARPSTRPRPNHKRLEAARPTNTNAIRNGTNVDAPKKLRTVSANRTTEPEKCTTTGCRAVVN